MGCGASAGGASAAAAEQPKAAQKVEAFRAEWVAVGDERGTNRKKENDFSERLFIVFFGVTI